MVIMRLLPDSVREYVQLHGSYGSFAEVRSAVDQYDQKLRAFGSGLHLNAVHQEDRRQGSRKSRGGDKEGALRADRGDRGDRKDRERGKCSSSSPSKKPTEHWNCGDPNHLTWNCSKPMKCRTVARRVTLPRIVVSLSLEKEKKARAKARRSSDRWKRVVSQSTARAGRFFFVSCALVSRCRSLVREG